MNKTDVKTKCKYRRWISFFWGSSKYERNGSRTSKYERNGSRTVLMWRPSDVSYFARDPLCSYFDEPQKNEIYFLNNYC